MNIKRIIKEEMEGWEQFEETSAVVDKLHEWMIKYDKIDLKNTVIDFNKPITIDDIAPFIHIFEELGVPGLDTFLKDMEGANILNIWINDSSRLLWDDESVEKQISNPNNHMIRSENGVMDDYEWVEYNILNASEIFGI